MVQLPPALGKQSNLQSGSSSTSSTPGWSLSPGRVCAAAAAAAAAAVSLESASATAAAAAVVVAELELTLRTVFSSFVEPTIWGLSDHDAGTHTLPFRCRQASLP